MIILVYNLNAFIMNHTDNEMKAYYGDEERVIIKGKDGYLITSYNHDSVVLENASEEYYIAVTRNVDNPDVVIPDDFLPFKISDIIAGSPCTEVNSKEYFHKRKSNGETFRMLLNDLKEIGIDTEKV